MSAILVQNSTHVISHLHGQELQLKTMIHHDGISAKLCRDMQTHHICQSFSIFPVPALTCRLARSRSIRRTLQRPSWQHRGGTRTSKGPRIALMRCAKATRAHWCPLHCQSHVSIAQDFKRTSNAWNDSIWNCHEWSCVCPSCVVPLVAEPAKEDRQSSEDAFAA